MVPSVFVGKRSNNQFNYFFQKFFAIQISSNRNYYFFIENFNGHSLSLIVIKMFYLFSFCFCFSKKNSLLPRSLVCKWINKTGAMMKALLIALFAIIGTTIIVDAQLRHSPSPIDTGKKVVCIYNHTCSIREGKALISIFIFALHNFPLQIMKLWNTRYVVGFWYRSVMPNIWRRLQTYRVYTIE